MAKILRVCTSEFLPSLTDRTSDYVYFVYDKMEIYLGKNNYTDPYCIVESVPDNAVEGMLYITLDGYLKTRLDSNIIEIGQIESEDQIEILKQAGTTYFMKAEYRYLDLQTRTIILPFQNGSYQLSVSAAADLMIDENTVIYYNPQSGCFEITGDTVDISNNTFNGLKGSETSTVRTTVSTGSIVSNLKVSSAEGNILKIFGNGLYANVGEVVNSEDLDNLVLLYSNYKVSVEAYMNELRQEMEDKGFNLTEEGLAAKILAAMEEYKPTIEDMFAKYENIYEQLGLIRDASVNYADSLFLEAKNEIINYLNNITNAWETFGYDYSNSDMDSTLLTEEEALKQAKVLEELRRQFILDRDIDTSTEYELAIEYYMVTDEDGMEGDTALTLLPESIMVESVAGSKVGETYLSVFPELEEGNSYYYKITDEIPTYGQIIHGLGYTKWDGHSQVELPNGEYVIIVEVDSEYKAVKYGEFKVESRLEAPKELEILKILSTEGSIENSTNLVITPSLNNGNRYFYGFVKTIPEYDSIILDTYKEWDGVSEISLSAFDKQMMTVVEASADLHRAKRFGIVYVDLANELLKLLVLDTAESSERMKTIIYNKTVTDKNNSVYYNKNVDVPELNAYISEADGWKKLTSGGDIEADFNDTIIVVEVTGAMLVKKANSITPIVNNDIVATATYNEMTALENIISYEKYSPDTELYYEYAGDVYSNARYGDAIYSSLVKAEVVDGQYIVPLDQIHDTLYIVEGKDGKVIRDGIISVDMKYAEDITFEATTEEFSEDVGAEEPPVTGYYLNIDNISVDTSGYTVYVQLLQEEDNKKFALNEILDTEEYYYYEKGNTTIEIMDMENITGIRVAVTDYMNRVKYVGTGVISN